MLKKLRPRSAYDVVALLALFAALGTGGAYAADTIGSADIINESIRSEDIKNTEIKALDIGPGQVLGSRITDETIKSNDIADGRVTGADIAPDTLTGADINEAELGALPGAPIKIRFEVGFNFAGEEVSEIAVGPWTLRLACAFFFTGGELGQIAHSTLSAKVSGPGDMQWSGSDWANNSQTPEDPVTPKIGGALLGAAPGTTLAAATAVADDPDEFYRTPVRFSRTAYLNSGSQVAMLQFNGAAGADDGCELYGHAINMS